MQPREVTAGKMRFVLWVSTKRVRREELLGPTFGKDKWEEKLVKYSHCAGSFHPLGGAILREKPTSNNISSSDLIFTRVHLWQYVMLM